MRGLFDHDVNAGAIIGWIAGAHHNRSGGRALLNDLGQFTARHTRHGIVGKHQVVNRGVKKMQGLLRVFCRFNNITEIVEKHFCQQPSVNIVIYQQHGSDPRF